MNLTQKAKIRGIWEKTIAIVAVVVIGYVVFKTCSGMLGEIRQTAGEVNQWFTKRQESAEKEKAQAERYASVLNSLSISNFEWEKKSKYSPEGTKNIMFIKTFTVNNTSDYRIKDFIISSSVYANSGTVLGTIEKVIYEVVEPRDSKIFRDIELGPIHEQTERANCKVTRFEFVQ